LAASARSIGRSSLCGAAPVSSGLSPPASEAASAAFVNASPALATLSGTGDAAGTGRAACVSSCASTSSGATTTRAPILVMPHSSAAKAGVSRMQPCEAGYPGTTPACSATPDQVMRCM
jgi:hypothetical protein